MTEDRHQSYLHVNKGISQPESLNPEAVKRLKKVKQLRNEARHYIDGIINGDRVLLSKAITLVESALEDHQALAQEIIEACLPKAGNTVRVGITGVPGAGKSTFIEALGMYLVETGKKVAVLTIDPSSQRSKGSILGDKTRMEKLSGHSNAYIRPSASAGTLGGVARKTRETMLLCEAAGYEIILVETVGVGQSEVAAHAMVDFFLLLMISGAGDELQGIKRGIMEMADGIVINKADGDNINKARRAMAECKNALHFFPPAESGVVPEVTTCSSLYHNNIENVWRIIDAYIRETQRNGFFDHKRKQQNIGVLKHYIEDQLGQRFYHHESIKTSLPDFETKVLNNSMSAYIAANKLLNIYFESVASK